MSAWTSSVVPEGLWRDCEGCLVLADWEGRAQRVRRLLRETWARHREAASRTGRRDLWRDDAFMPSRVRCVEVPLHRHSCLLVTFAVALYSIHLVTRDTSARSIESRINLDIPRQSTGHVEHRNKGEIP